MAIHLTAADMKALFPKAPKAILDDFVAKQDSILGPAGINHTRNRLKFFFANIEHETNGFTIRNLTENTNYTAARMAAVWPNRFSSAADVVARFGRSKGWQLRALDEIYGDRMGNRPGTRDGSIYIGRGGPQITGRDGYRQVGQRAKLPLEDKPELATRPENQTAVCAAFWTWKGMNKFADTGDFVGCVRRWNGGTNGLADRRARMAGNEAIINRLKGSPPTATPTKADLDTATETERKARNVGAGGVAVGTGTEAAQQTGMLMPGVLPAFATGLAVGVGLSIFVVATVLIVRKHRKVIDNWF